MAFSHAAKRGGGAAPRSRQYRSSVGRRWTPETLQEALRPFGQTKAVRFCGVAPVHEASHIEVWRESEPGDNGLRRSWFTNTQHCDSPWACPVCGPRLAAERGELIDEVVHAWGRSRVSMGTFKVRHQKGDSFHALAKGVSRAFRRMQQSHAFRALGVEFVRALEATYGGYAGLHPHIHALLFSELVVDEDLRSAMLATLAHEWAVAVRAEMGAAHVPREGRGVFLNAATHARYLTKFGFELASPATKQSKPGHLSMGDVARRAADGNRGYQAIWCDWQNAMRGRMALTWSKGKNSKLAALRERVEKELEEKRDARKRPRELVCVLPRSIWNILCSFGVNYREQILDALEGNGDEADVWEVVTDALNARAPPPADHYTNSS